MKGLFRQAKQFYARNKISDFEYDCVRAEIYSTNNAILSVCSFVSVALFLILTLVSIIFKDRAVFRDHYVYGSFLLSMAAVFIAVRKLPEKYQKWNQFILYFFIWSYYIYTIYNGVFDRPDSYAVIFFVLFFACPLIFVDKVKRMYISTFTACVIFSICSVLVKKPEYWKADVFNAIVLFGLSYLPGFYLAKIRVREFSLRQIIESERDTDGLTGLLNKGAFIRNAKRNINATKDGILIIMDLDFFKQINDTYGHFVGDHVLKLVSVCINQTFRSSDVMGRFGGDEFVILMAKTNLTDIALMRCNQLLERLHNTKIFPDDTAKDNVTIHASIGFAPYTGESDFDELFQKADKALYQAKNSGKDKACQYQ